MKDKQKSKGNRSNIHKHNSIYSDVRDDFYVEIAEGGHATRVVQQVRDVFKSGRERDWVRGKITEFTRGARGRMMWLCASLNEQMLQPNGALGITLTYPSKYVVHKGKEIRVQDIDGKLYKKHLNHIMTRLRQKYPKMFGVVRYEWQQRGVGHYHLALFGTNGRKGGFIPIDWLLQTWNKVVGGEHDEDHRKIGVDIQPMRNWRETRSYFSKRIAALPVEDGDNLGDDKDDTEWNQSVVVKRQSMEQPPDGDMLGEEQDDVGPKDDEDFTKRVGWLSYMNKKGDHIVDKETGEVISKRPIGKHWTYVNMREMKRHIKRITIVIPREQYFAMQRTIFRYMESCKRRQIMQLDEAGYLVYDTKRFGNLDEYKCYVKRKIMSGFQTWKRTRINLGGSLKVFFPNAVVNRLLCLFGYSGKDFDETKDKDFDDNLLQYV